MELIEKTIADAVSTLLKNPLYYFSESDIHSFVYSIAIQNDCSLNDLIDTQVSIGLNRNKEMSTKKYKTIRIHREYGINGIDYARCDLVVFEKEEIEKINDPINLKKGKSKNDYLEPEYIIEFGTEKSAGSVNQFEEHLRGDLQKIVKAKRKGFIVHIQRVYNRDNDLDKYDEYVQVLVKKISEYDKMNIRVIFALVSIGCEGKAIFKEGKVKLYSKKKKSLVSISADKYEEAILNELE